jgi:hypothetical protein
MRRPVVVLCENPRSLALAVGRPAGGSLAARRPAGGSRTLAGSAARGVAGVLVALGVLVAACGGPPAPQPTGRLAGGAPSVSVAPPEPGPRGWVSRASVDRALKAGLGRFLSNGEVEVQLDGARRFVGWRIVALHDAPDDLWKGVDLRVGDVVTSVNGFPLERPQQADRAFKSLRVSSEIRVYLLRDGRPMELRFAIVEEGEQPPVDASASAAPATSATVLPSLPSSSVAPKGSGPAPSASASTGPIKGGKK